MGIGILMLVFALAQPKWTSRPPFAQSLEIPAKGTVPAHVARADC